MEGLRISILVTLMGFILLSTNMKTYSSALTTNNYNNTNTQFIKTCCNTTTYPNVCLNSLSSYSTKIKTSYKKLAYTAISVSLKRAQSITSIVSKLSRKHGMKPSETAAVKDCVEIISDSIDELRQSLREVKNLNGTDLDYKMSNIKTWVSAALTDDDTGMDGLDEESVNVEVRNVIRKNVVSVAQLTSNALVLVNSLNATRVNSL